MVGESQINVEVTDSFTAKMAHDIINQVMDIRRMKSCARDTMKREVEEAKGVSEEEMFRHLSSRGKKLTD